MLKVPGPLGEGPLVWGPAGRLHPAALIPGSSTPFMTSRVCAAHCVPGAPGKWALRGGGAAVSDCLIVVLGKTLENPLDCKEIQPVHPKGNQSWVIIGGTDVEAEIQYFDHLMQRADLLEKTLMLGKTEGRRRRG